ncbi:MAG: monofunctional biosynthetic peptidoglycan transglycosylase [Henriciella sp.]|nr:monofunctional biosynthetic peptidoglycan transglycosylase [Henriciella sp.]
MAQPFAKSDQRRSIVDWVWIGIKFLGGLFVTVHVYALILFYAPVPATATMAERVIEHGRVYRSWTPIEEVSPHLVRAVIAAEDTRFCLHNGVDVDAIRTALDERERTGRLRGASTITQQTAKNVFLWNGGGFARKAPEAWMAVFIDGFWGKRRVLEVYLNVAEWGDGLFGIEAAAWGRFGKPARDLTAGEAALLAAVLPSPNKWRVDPPGPYVASRARGLLARMNTVERDGLAACVFLP